MDDPPVEAPADAVLIVDGSFLQRSELAAHWDQTVFVDTSFPIARARGVERDATSLGGFDVAEEAFNLRYHAAARIYLAAVRPQERASIVIGNDDLDFPSLRRRLTSG